MKSTIKQFKIPIILATLCLILGLILTTVLISRGKNEGGDITDEPTIESLVATYPRGKVDYIRVTNRECKLSLKKNGDSWTYVVDNSIPTDTESIVKLLNEFEILSALRVLDSGENSQYGLDDPSASLLIGCNGAEHTLSFGTRSAYYDGYYMSVSGDNHVYIVDKRYYNTLTSCDYTILGLPNLPDLSGISDVTFTYQDGERVTVQNSDDTLLTAAISSIVPTERIELTEVHDDSYGLNVPVICTINHAGGEYVLHFGQDGSGMFTYLRLDGSTAVYLFEADNVDRLIEYITR